MERFEIVKKLGRGSYGSAVAAMRKDTKELVVIKRVDMTEMDEAEKKQVSLWAVAEQLLPQVQPRDALGQWPAGKRPALSRPRLADNAQAMTEAALLNVLKHPGIIAYHEAFIEDDVLNIVMEYAERGDLQKAIRAQRKAGRHFSEDQILQWAAQLSLALQNIHAHHVLHRDLKTANCFLLASGVVKVGDFGIAKVLERTAAQANTQIGTPYFLSPEAVSAKPYGRASDVWGLGCVLFEVCSLRRVFTASSLLALVYKIVNEPVPEIPAHYSPELRDLVAAMLEKDADRRPSAADILAMPVMQRVLREMAGPAADADAEGGDEEEDGEAGEGRGADAPSPGGGADASAGSAVGFASGSGASEQGPMDGSGGGSLVCETAVVDADISPGAVFATARGGGGAATDAWGVGGASLVPAGGRPAAGSGAGSGGATPRSRDDEH
ncbi:nek3, partial [Symbiodinium sp. KB8]